MIKRSFIFLSFMCCALLFSVVLFAADPAVTADKSEQVVPDKPSAAGQALKGSKPSEGAVIGKPLTEDEMMSAPVKKKKGAQEKKDVKK